MAANSDLTRLLRDNEEHLSNMCKSNPLELSKKMFKKLILTDSDLFQSLDHSRVEPQLQVRYLLRLVAVRVREDGSVWEKFMTLLASMGERQMYDYLSELTSDSDTDIWYDCQSEFSSENEVYTNGLSMPESGNGTYLHTPIGVEDASWILEVLVQASHKWELIARALNLPNYEIHNCRRIDNKLSLDNVILFWLNRDGNTSPGTTLNTLLSALRSKLVEENRIAQQLENTNKPLIGKPKVSDSSFCLADQSCDVEVTDGKSTLLHFQTSPKEPVYYQWKKDGQPLVNSSTYYGVNEDIIVVSHASQGTEGEYTCCVSCRGSEKCSNKITLTVLYPPAKKRLLDLYSIHREVPPDSWPPVGTKLFINLTVIQSDNKHNDKNDLDMSEDRDKLYNDIFGEYKSRKLIIIEGRPGSGKTTLVHKMIKDWSKGAILKKAKYVFLITLRIVNRNSIQETLSSILGSFYRSNEELRMICEEIEATNGKEVCFIIDGLDEYHPQDRDNSLIYQLLDKTFLPLAMIIVTSRPVAINNVTEEAVTQTVEVLGFNKDQIIEYIHSFPFDSSSHDSQIATTYPAKLKQYLHSHPSVNSMCYLPVHAAMICFLFKYLKGSIPSTQTKIYKEFTRSSILRYLRRQNSKAQVPSLNELRGSTKEHFNKLCKLAYSMTKNGKQLVTSEAIDEELYDYISSDSDEWCLGLVTINHIAELSGIYETYSFLHLTVQEFLSAYYITTLEQDKQIEIFSQISNKLSPVLIFYFGLGQSQNNQKLKVLEMLPVQMSYYYPRIYLSILEGGLNGFKSGVLCHCALESQQPTISNQVGKECKGKYSCNNATPSDLLALSYVICNTTHPVIEISLDSPRDFDCDYTEFLQCITHKDFSKLQTLCFYKMLNNVEAQAASKLLQFGVSLTCAALSFHKISRDCARSITDKFQYLSSLQYIRISCYSTSDGITELLGKLTHFTNVRLLLEFYDINSSVVLEIGTSLQFLTKNDLFKLVLKGCHIDNDAATAVTGGLQCIRNTIHLEVSHNSIHHVGIITLLHKIHCLSKLIYLYLSHSNIHCNGATILANQLEHLTDLAVLDLSHNNIGPSGLVSLGGALHHHSNLVVLDVSHNQVDLRSAITVISASSDNLVCINLNIDTKANAKGNGIHVEGLVSPEDNTVIDDLVAAMQHFTRMRDLHLGFKSVLVKPATQEVEMVIYK